MEFCGVYQGNLWQQLQLFKLLEKMEQKFPTNAVKLTQVQAIRSRIEMATLFPNDHTWE
jgi:hypothetical protein